MPRRATAAVLAVALAVAGAGLGAHAAREGRENARKLNYAAIGGTAFGEDTWAADLIEAALDPIIEGVSGPSLERISGWASAQTSGTFA